MAGVLWGTKLETESAGGGEPQAQQWIQWYVLRMVWVRRDGVWRGKWWWEDYDRIREWAGSFTSFTDERRDGNIVPSATSNVPWGTVPQEVLLGVVRRIDPVSPCSLYLILRPTEPLHQGQGSRNLFALSEVCRAWYAICAPDLPKTFHIRSPRIDELIGDLSKPGSRLARDAEGLAVVGLIPWLSLPKLLKLLPRLRELDIQEHMPTSPTVYHPGMLRWSSATRVTSRTLTGLQIRRLWFPSATDVLRLLAHFPRLSTAHFNDCTIHIASETTLPISSTNLSRMYLSQPKDLIHTRTIPSLTQFWQWPHPVVNPEVEPYPGLHLADAQGVAAVIGSVAGDGFEWYS